MFMLGAITPLLVLSVFLIGIPLLVGFFVYRDAKARGMEAVLWTLVVVLVPSFIGLIVYLIVRSSHTATVCARCGAPVEETFVCCPSCGAKLKYTCPACGQPVDAGWRLCAHCGAELEQGRPQQIVRRGGGSLKGLWIVLGAAVLAVVLVIAALVLLTMANYAAIGTEVTTQIVSAQMAA